MTTIERRRLADHITDALTAMAARILERHPERADDLADWLETAHERVIVRADVGRSRKGRIRHDSLRLHVFIDHGPPLGLAPLCTVRVRDLVDAEGLPIDAKATARELLWQHGHGIPDDLSGLDDAS